MARLSRCLVYGFSILVGCPRRSILGHNTWRRAREREAVTRTARRDGRREPERHQPVRSADQARAEAPAPFSRAQLVGFSMVWTALAIYAGDSIRARRIEDAAIPVREPRLNGRDPLQ